MRYRRHEEAALDEDLAAPDGRAEMSGALHGSREKAARCMEGLKNRTARRVRGFGQPGCDGRGRCQAVGISDFRRG
jgi:hypothetical protein